MFPTSYFSREIEVKKQDAFSAWATDLDSKVPPRAWWLLAMCNDPRFFPQVIELLLESLATPLMEQSFAQIHEMQAELRRLLMVSAPVLQRRQLVERYSRSGGWPIARLWLLAYASNCDLHSFTGLNDKRSYLCRATRNLIDSLCQHLKDVITPLDAVIELYVDEFDRNVLSIDQLSPQVRQLHRFIQLGLCVVQRQRGKKSHE